MCSIRIALISIFHVIIIKLAVHNYAINRGLLDIQGKSMIYCEV